jgi:hypothetical protein
LKRLALLTAVVAAALTATGQAGARHYVPHKPFAKMTTAQKERWLERQTAHAQGAAAWLDRHLQSEHVRRRPEASTTTLLSRGVMLERWRVELRWFRSSAQIAERNLDALRVVSESWAEFSCIHGYEGAADANTGNGYYGGLQMDLGFQQTYGPEFLARYGTADHWPVSAQVTAARRARDSGRGYGPWPNTARWCGQL